MLLVPNVLHDLTQKSQTQRIVSVAQHQPLDHMLKERRQNVLSVVVFSVQRLVLSCLLSDSFVSMYVLHKLASAPSLKLSATAGSSTKNLVGTHLLLIRR